MLTVELRGRRVGVVGLQRTGVATVKFLLAHGARVFATEAMPLEKLSAPAQELCRAERPDLQVALGDAEHRGLDACELVIVSPGVPTAAPPLQRARAAGAEVIGEVEFAYRSCPARIIAITGTKGKTTTTALVGAMLNAAHIPHVVAGNIGVPLIGAVDELTTLHWVVLEVSSFQLETTVHFHPRVAVLLNLHADHLDRHPTVDAYLAAKLRIFANQTLDDIAVLNADQPLPEVAALTSLRRVFSLTDAVADARLRDDALWLGNARLVGQSELMLLGHHNVGNLLAAALAAREAGVDLDAIRHVARTFPGVPHRLELVTEINGVKFINDSQGTTLAATIAGLESLEVPIVLIAGGQAKVNDFGPLGEAIARHARALVVIGQDGGRLADAAAAHGFTAIHRVDTLPEAVRLAATLCPSPGVVLLSPACASFDMFRNAAHRGEVFREAALALADS